MTATLDPLLVRASPGDLVGVNVRCPRYDCHREWQASAEVVNKRGVMDVMPRRCTCGVTGAVIAIEALFLGDRIVYAPGYTGPRESLGFRVRLRCLFQWLGDAFQHAPVYV